MRRIEPLLASVIVVFFVLPRSAPAMTEVEARSSSRDVMIPRALVERVEEDHKAFLLRENRVYRKEAFKRQLINVTADLTQKKLGALREDTRILTPIGGGIVDLAEVVLPVRGSFSLFLKPQREDGEPFVPSRVFFISRSKERTLTGLNFGSGCGKFMDITSEFQKQWSTLGFELYTADQRYVSVIGGTFVFVQYAKEALFVGAITFTDSRYPQLLCE